MASDSITRIREQAANMRRIFAAAGPELMTRPVDRSAWSVGAHFDHTIKVAHSILSQLANPQPVTIRRGINMLGRAVLAIGWIPRGRGRSPEKLRGAVVMIEELRERLSVLESLIAQVAAKTDLPPRTPVIPHPAFGGLTYAQALRFVAIHNHHHLKIVAPLVQ